MKPPKILIIGIDALIPDLVFNNLNRFPTIERLCKSGAYGAYDAYCYGYGSHDNWLSLYTGLTPKQHGTRDNLCLSTGGYTLSDDYKHLDPFWTQMNNQGLSVGLWRPIVTSPPQDIDGYMLCAEPQTERVSSKPSHIHLEYHPKMKHLAEQLEGNLIIQPLPNTPDELGYSWDTLRKNTDLSDRVIVDDYYKEGTEYFNDEMEYFERNIIKIQSSHPVDVLFYYTATLDLIQHFQVHEKSKNQILLCIDALDKFVNNLQRSLNPESIILFSDHGTKAFSEFFPNTPIDIQKEAFGLRDKSVWLSNGEIVTEARNGAPLMGVHSLKGTFIGSGPQFKHTKIENMRTVDFYPTLLEMLNIPIPADRTGYIVDILDKEILNSSHVFPVPLPQGPQIAILQTEEVAKLNSTINEVFLDNRFSQLTVIGQEKYRHVFLANPRVANFESVQGNSLSKTALEGFDKVCIPNPNPFDPDNAYIAIA